MSEKPAKPSLMSLEEVLVRLAELVAPHQVKITETVALSGALGRVLAQPVQALVNVPPADNSAMDGYAVRCVDLADLSKALPVRLRIPAGHPATEPLPEGAVARIFTGAPIPEGADAVIMQEECIAEETAAGSVAESLPMVRFTKAPAVGQWIRRCGEDVEARATILHAGHRLTPESIGLAAAVGVARLIVVRRPKVALLCTGDELALPGEALKPGTIYNSNRFMLHALLQAIGCEVSDLGQVPDRLEATRLALREAAARHDLILTTGGASVGEEDHLRPAAQAEGRLDFWKMAVKPGKPLSVGTIVRPGKETLLIGLPGNPVASYVTFWLAVAPVLKALQGGECTIPQAMPATADFEWPHGDTRREFLRVRMQANGRLALYANQSSGVLSSVVWADGLVDNPAGQTIRRGDTVMYRPLAMLAGA